MREPIAILQHDAFGWRANVQLTCWERREIGEPTDLWISRARGDDCCALALAGAGDFRYRLSSIHVSLSQASGSVSIPANGNGAPDAAIAT